MRFAIALLVLAALIAVTAPAAEADQRAAAAELEGTHLLYSRSLWRAAHPVAPGRRGTLRRVAAAGTGAARAATRDPWRYAVEVEGGLDVDPAEVARTVDRVLADRRGWRSAGHAFLRVRSGPVDLRVVLASPRLTDALCAPLLTNGRYSCASGRAAILNAARWLGGAAAYGRDLDGYRTYMVNHEVGHVLGHGHATCTAGGRRAPVMMQQTKGVGACRANPWPLPRERW